MNPSQPVRVMRQPEGAAGDDRVATEEPLEIRVEGRPLAVTMRTPGHDQELAAGFLYSEGVVDGADDVLAIAKIRDPLDPQDNTIDVRLAEGIRADRFASAQRAFFASSSCGICGKATLDNVLRVVPPLGSVSRASSEQLLALPSRMRAVQETFERTGGLHAAALFTIDGRLEVLREDIGRHNAVDKILGWRLLADAVPVDDRVLLTSGRASFEIVQKALVARVPVLAALGAPSSLAVDLAERSGMQLVGFLGDGGFNEYA
ncbi:MAG TPA: formate dehydrogenase accessory sulfurtransferase FdhD [Myxococcota bacterium]|nr:formate dehydrogenase accessory sulfurtransferase FdhD [Myxococcota bacterium]